MGDPDRWREYLSALERNGVSPEVATLTRGVWASIVAALPDPPLPTVHVDNHEGRLLLSWDGGDYVVEVDVVSDGLHWFYCDDTTGLTDGTEDEPVKSLPLPPHFYDHLRLVAAELKDQEGE